MVHSQLRKQPFGMDFYSPPKMERLLIPPRNVKIGKLNIPGFAEAYAKSKAFVPSPSHYSTMVDWGQ